jgi:hypothetical protein
MIPGTPYSEGNFFRKCVLSREKAEPLSSPGLKFATIHYLPTLELHWRASYRIYVPLWRHFVFIISWEHVHRLSHCCGWCNFRSAYSNRCQNSWFSFRHSEICLFNFPDVYKEEEDSNRGSSISNYCLLARGDASLPFYSVCLHPSWYYRHSDDRSPSFCSSNTSLAEFLKPTVLTIWGRWHNSVSAIMQFSWAYFLFDVADLNNAYDQCSH